MIRLLTLFVALVFSLGLSAQQLPTISPVAVTITPTGEEETTSYSGSAPLEVRFEARSENDEGWTAFYEWHFYEPGKEANPYLIRREKDTPYTFNKAGTTLVALHATFVMGTDTIAYTDEYWATATPITITISESKLEIPNAFSPNGDGINDVYRVKEGYQSIIRFRARIFNRWGQKLYEWTDITGGWDGTFHGSPVKDGTYFVVVEAEGADGRKYTIKKDVNILRAFTEGGTTTP